MPSQIYPIDWRDEFSAIQPYLNESGGVVRIRYTGEQCAPHAFTQALKSVYESKKGNSIWRSLRIDREVYSVRYLAGIRSEFMRIMQFELPDPTNTGTTATAELNVAKDIKAKGSVNVTVSGVEQNTYHTGDNPILMEDGRKAWIGELCDRLSEFLKNNHMMIVMNNGNRDDQDQFWRYMWQNRLDHLVELGLLLVHMVEETNGNAQIHDMAPTPDVEVDLPLKLDERRQQDAVSDLTEIFGREVPDLKEKEARAAAQTHVHGHCDDVRRLHDKLPGLIMRLGRSDG